MRGKGGPGFSAEEDSGRAEQEDTSPLAKGTFFPGRCRSVSCRVTLEGGEMDCNRNNLSVISARRGCRLQTFFFFFLFFRHPVSCWPESPRTSAASEHRTQMPFVCCLNADWAGQRGREVPLGRGAAHRGWTVTLCRIFKCNLLGVGWGGKKSGTSYFSVSRIGRCCNVMNKLLPLENQFQTVQKHFSSAGRQISPLDGCSGSDSDEMWTSRVPFGLERHLQEYNTGLGWIFSSCVFCFY